MSQPNVQKDNSGVVRELFAVICMLAGLIGLFMSCWVIWGVGAAGLVVSVLLMAIGIVLGIDRKKS